MFNNIKITGGCACSKVKYELSGETTGVINCHCKFCQRSYGNYCPMLITDKANFTITKGEDNLTVYKSSDSAPYEGIFCSNCGSQLFKRQLEGSRVVVIVGSLDNTDGLRPTKNIYAGFAGDYYSMPEVK